MADMAKSMSRGYQLLGEVGFLYLIPKSLRTNQAHRSAGRIAQRFDHPPPPASKSDLDDRTRNVCFNPMS